MTDLAPPLGLFAAGLASGLHCAGMCGGISASFSLLQKEKIWKRQFAFNAGRITTYAATGAAAGALGSAAAYAAAKLRGWAGLATLRRLTGALLIGLGGFGVAHASGLGETLRQTLACF